MGDVMGIFEIYQTKHQQDRETIHSSDEYIGLVHLCLHIVYFYVCFV